MRAITLRYWTIFVALGGSLALTAATLAQGSLAEEAAAQGKIPTKNLLDVMYEGGPLMYPIGLCSFVLLVFVFERFIALRRGRIIPRPFVKRILEQLREGQLDREKALQLCEDNRSPVAVVFAAAVKKWGRTSVEVEQAILPVRQEDDHRQGVAGIGELQEPHPAALNHPDGRPLDQQSDLAVAIDIDDSLVRHGGHVLGVLDLRHLYIDSLLRIDKPGPNHKKDDQVENDVQHRRQIDRWQVVVVRSFEGHGERRITKFE